MKRERRKLTRRELASITSSRPMVRRVLKPREEKKFIQYPDMSDKQSREREVNS